MKKITCIFLVLLLALALPLTSCVALNTEPKAPVIPKGYLAYDNGDITFAYPEKWIVNDGSVVMIVNESGVGNNITVTYEQYSDMYSTMTAETFNSTLKPMLDAAGIAVSNTVVEQVKNEVSTEITKISYSANANGVSMKQTMLICAAGNRNYIIQLVKNVFETLYVK